MMAKPILEHKTGILQQKAQKGYLSGMMVFEFFSTGMPAIAASAGADFLMYDMEHTGIGFETLKAQMAACRGLDIAPLVRVPTTEGNTIGQALDIGAHGVMVPMVETAQQARDLVRCAYYPPQGVRGTAFGIAHDDYSQDAPAQIMKQANQRTLVIAMIETATGLANVEEIAAVDGIDVLWLGHFDLTSSMGIAGQLENPEYLAAIARIVAAAKAQNKMAGYMAMNDKFAREYWAHGFRMLAYGLDHVLLRSALAEGMTLIDTLSKREPGEVQ
jgi:2-dehydro-3-deoxyglucarate aldolase/4-hydroxy-2-oxoheptanedioate aldolase